MEEELMNDERAVSVLLHWRLREAEAEAPPPPSAARLLERARPWWDQLPERARALFERLRRTQAAYGHAQAEARRARCGHPVPALVIRGQEEVETSARVLYLDVRDGRMRLRFQLDGAACLEEETLEATFVSEAATEPLFCAQVEIPCHTLARAIQISR